MTVDLEKIFEALLSILFLPSLKVILDFSWGAKDPFWIMTAKRIFILLPALAVVWGYWTTIISLLSVPIRSQRKQFLTLNLVTWWDLLRAIFFFWAGLLRFVLVFATTLFALLRVTLMGVWTLVFDLVSIPFRLASHAGNSMVNTGVPWVAVFLTLFWSLLEATIFTFVTTNLVMETLTNITGEDLTPGFIRIPLFLFMLFIVLGSYAVLSEWARAYNSKDVGTIIKIGAIELVAMFVEVMFLYREFVDALIPWFAQYSGSDSELGIFSVLLISSLTWFGIRSMSWFLFASYGTPTIMGIIQGKGIPRSSGGKSSGPKIDTFELTNKLIKELKNESKAMQEVGDKFVEAFVIPPLQIVAGATNFSTLVFSSRHLFELPLKGLKDIKEARDLLKALNEKSSK